MSSWMNKPTVVKDKVRPLSLNENTLFGIWPLLAPGADTNRTCWSFKMKMHFKRIEVMYLIDSVRLSSAKGALQSRDNMRICDQRVYYIWFIQMYGPFWRNAVRNIICLYVSLMMCLKWHILIQWNINLTCFNFSNTSWVKLKEWLVGNLRHFNKTMGKSMFQTGLVYILQRRVFNTIPVLLTHQNWMVFQRDGTKLWAIKWGVLCWHVINLNVFGLMLQIIVRLLIHYCIHCLFRYSNH